MVQLSTIAKIHQTLRSTDLPEEGVRDGFGWSVEVRFGIVEVKYTGPGDQDFVDFNAECEKLAEALTHASYDVNLKDLEIVYPERGIRTYQATWRLFP